jgi:hypothetical protein
MNLIAKITGYRTVLFNLLVLIAGIFGRDLPISGEEFDAALLGVAVLGNIGMRFVTKTPIGGAAS